MRLDPGTEFSTPSTVTTALVEVPETGTYRSADGKVSKFYRAGDRVSRAEYDLLQMAPVEIAGDVEPEAKAEPKPSNKAEKPPRNKAAA